ncbi:hypothetical protein [Micrococcus lylae]|uniref:hypothetical protein n=1 Tax=Micrococcus lylae TaxID=1273 RepID=UPI000C807FEE|nr:hypothetical protein [Micrococcus lylae]WIK82131.1 hypothetical protein CJ228_011185 [Micrococcus lylae]
MTARQIALVDELGMTEREVSWLFPADGTLQARVQVAVRLLAFLLAAVVLLGLYLASHAVAQTLGDLLVGATSVPAMSLGVIR